VEIDPETVEARIDPITKRPVPIDPKESITVFVDVTAYNSSRYYVEGDAVIPGRLTYTGNDTVLDVIHYSGGLLPSADRSRIRLIRSFPKGSPVQVLPIDYEEIAMGTDSSTNYMLLPNDRLVIPRVQNGPFSNAHVDQSQGPSRTPPGGTYFSRNPSTDQATKQLEALRSLEQHLSEVEKKLDKIINAMEREKEEPAEKAAGSRVTRRKPDEVRKRGDLIRTPQKSQSARPETPGSPLELPKED
jgi:hypothetical protein